MKLAGLKYSNPSQPQPYVPEVLKYKKSGKLLDLGCGWGRSAVYFAKKGFEVTAVDRKDENLDELRELAAKDNLQVKIIKADLKKFKPVDQFDVVLCTNVLYFFKRADVKKIVKLMQQHTKPGGLNLVSVFTDKNKKDVDKDNPYGRFKHWFTEGELADFYKQWKTLEHYSGLSYWFRRYWTDDKTWRRDYREYILAQKAKGT